MKPKLAPVHSESKVAQRSDGSRPLLVKSNQNSVIKKRKGNFNGESSTLQKHHSAVGNLKMEVYECLEYLLEDEDIVLQNQAAENYIVIEPSQSGEYDYEDEGTLLQEHNDGELFAKQISKPGPKMRKIVESGVKDKLDVIVKSTLENVPKQKLEAVPKLSTENTSADNVILDLDVTPKYKESDKLLEISKSKLETNKVLENTESVLNTTRKFKTNENMKVVGRRKLDVTRKSKAEKNKSLEVTKSIPKVSPKGKDFSSFMVVDGVKNNMDIDSEFQTDDSIKSSLVGSSKRKLNETPKIKMKDNVKYMLMDGAKCKLVAIPKLKNEEKNKKALTNSARAKSSESYKVKMEASPKHVMEQSSKSALEYQYSSTLPLTKNARVKEKELPVRYVKKKPESLYEQLWDQATDTRLPSLLWSVHREQNGRFVSFVHLSENSTSDGLVVDKALVFENNCQPVIHMRGIRVDLAHVPDELESLEQVAGILRRIDKLLLCEGIHCSSEKQQRYSDKCRIFADKVKNGVICLECEQDNIHSREHKRKTVGS